MHFRSFTFYFDTEKGRVISKGKIEPNKDKRTNYILLQIKASNNGDELEEIHIVVALDYFIFNKTIGIEELDLIKYRMIGGSEEESLLERLVCYLKRIPEEEIERVIGWKKASDNFVICVSLYLSLLFMFVGREVWNYIPFQFPLPLSRVDVNCLGQGLFKYLQFPYQTEVSISSLHPILREMFSSSLELINVWGSAFEIGTTYETSKLVIEVLSSYVTYIIGVMGEVGDLSCRLKKVEDEIEELKKCCKK